MEKKLFYVDKSPVNEKYSIYNKLNTVGIFLTYGGSYNIFSAHILGMEYPTFLRMCRDAFGAELIGKEGWTAIYYDKRENAEAVANILNKTINLILVEKEIIEKNRKILEASKNG